MKPEMKTQRLIIDAVLAEDLKSMAYAQRSTVDCVLHELISRAASDMSWTGELTKDQSFDNWRKGTRNAVM